MARTRTEASFDFLASLLMPADARRRGVLLKATSAWRLQPGRAPRDADVVLWGAPAARADRGIRSSLPSAIRRELRLRMILRRPPEGLMPGAVHRLPPLTLRPRTLRGRVNAAVFGGALVELHRARGTIRVLDELADAAGVGAGAQHIRPGAGVSAWIRARRVDGVDVLVRLGATEGPSDPHGAAACLDRLEAAGIEQVPRVLSRGRRDSVSWTVESALAGSTPTRLTTSLIAASARFLALLPVSDRPPTAPTDDLLAIREALPSRRDEIDDLVEWIERRLRSLPAVLRHGDLWKGNLLADRGSLTGVIDWDAWHLAGVPGTDLMHLVVMERALRTRSSFGRIWREGPWRLPEFHKASLVYWPRLSLAPDEKVLEAVALAGWAAQAASTLRRVPALATTRRWVLRNIDPMLTAGGS